MFNRRDIIYLYDGSFEGLLTAVFISFEKHEIPFGIEINENVQERLDITYFYVDTDFEKAVRVQKSLYQKITPKAEQNVFYAYLSNSENKEMKILAYIHRCYKYEKSVNSHLNDKYVAAILNAVQFVTNEAHNLKGFIRFSELDGGILYAEISPVNRVLPCLIYHFTERYSNLPFMINDLVHHECLVYNGKQAVINPTDDLTPKLNFTENELHHRQLWKKFYETVEIKERHNEKCQMTHMPKRYWKHLTEMQ